MDRNNNASEGDPSLPPIPQIYETKDGGLESTGKQSEGKGVTDGVTDGGAEERSGEKGAAGGVKEEEEREEYGAFPTDEELARNEKERRTKKQCACVPIR